MCRLTPARKAAILSRYGLSEAEFWEIAGDSCAICGKPWSPSRMPVVDHAHAGEPGEHEVRGAPCSACNDEIGRRQGHWYLAAAKYLFCPPAREVVGRRRVPGAPPPPADKPGGGGPS